MTLFSSIFISLTIISFIVLIILSRRRIDEEKTIKPLFEEQCGGKFGSMNFTIPFVRHTIYNSFIIVSYANKKIKIYFDKINTIRIKRHLISIGVTYEYISESGITEKVIIWTRFPDQIKNLLSSKGLKIT